MLTSRRSALALLSLLFAAALLGQPQPTATFPITRASGPIVIDDDLSDAGWKDAVRAEKWYETNVSDNGDPKVKNVGCMTYDDHFFYAAFHFEDPNPEKIRAPLADRHNVPSSTDYAGVIL